MFARQFHYFSSVFLLLIFLGARGVEAHSLSHADEENGASCEWCEYIVVLDHTPFQPPASPDWEARISIPFAGEPPQGILPGFCPQALKGTLFSRPPPAPTRG